jgi:hypothetical protein
MRVGLDPEIIQLFDGAFSVADPSGPTIDAEQTVEEVLISD